MFPRGLVKVPYLILLCWVVITGLGLYKYAGSAYLYMFFSSLSLVILFSVWVGPKSYFYIFISLFWILGFWLKVSVHVYFGLDYGEPVGMFDGSPSAWDHALVVISVGLLASLIFRATQMFFLAKIKEKLQCTMDVLNVPKWYYNYSAYVWGISLIVILGTAVVNYKWGVFQVGVMPNILPLKFNALIAAALNLIFPLWITTLIWWDVCLSKPFFFRFLAAIYEASIGSVSVLSRGVYVFHVLHYLVSSYINWDMLHLSKLRYLCMTIIFILGSVGVSLTSTYLRDSFYVVDKAQHQQIQHKQIQHELEKYKVQTERVKWHNDFYQGMMAKGFSNAEARMLTLLIDRWIGLEGVLAVSSYDRKSLNLFVNGWLEKSSLSTKPVYNYISNSIYIDANNTLADDFLFSSLPGLIAMLYYSGSLFIVFIGVLFMFVLLGGPRIFYLSNDKESFFSEFFWNICG